MFFKIMALVLMAIFYIFYFSKMISQKFKGISTDQLGKGKSGFLKFIEITLKITTYILPILQVIIILLYNKTMPLILQIIGISVEFLGVLAFILSVLEMKDNWRAGVQRKDKTNPVVLTFNDSNGYNIKTVQVFMVKNGKAERLNVNNGKCNAYENATYFAQITTEDGIVEICKIK